MKIDIFNSQKRIKIDPAKIKRLAKDVLSQLGEANATLSIYIVDDDQIRRLNYHYRNIDRPTDVLAFSMREGQVLKGTEGILGDVVISAQTVLRRAQGCAKKVTWQLRLYLVHGILHLVGYDDKTRAQRSQINRLQEAFLKANTTRKSPSAM